MLFRRTPKETPIEQVYEEIEEYCRTRDPATGIGGSWEQEPYKFDFMNIFSNAYWNGYCGLRGWAKENAAHRRGKRTTKKYAITGERLRKHLEKKWFKGKARTKLNKRMIDDLCLHWDEWTYAFDFGPGHFPRKYVRRRK
jgi:hypothetical protein